MNILSTSELLELVAYAKLRSTTMEEQRMLQAGPHSMMVEVTAPDIINACGVRVRTGGLLVVDKGRISLTFSDEEGTTQCAQLVMVSKRR